MPFQQLLCAACSWSGVPSGFSDKHSKNRHWFCFLIQVFCKKSMKGRWCESSHVSVNRVPSLEGRAVNCCGLCSPGRVREEADHTTLSYSFFCMRTPDVFAFLFHLILPCPINDAETYRFLKRSIWSKLLACILVIEFSWSSVERELNQNKKLIFFPPGMLLVCPWHAVTACLVCSKIL